MKRRAILFVLLAVLLSGSVSADRKKLGEGDRSFFYYLYEDFILENAEGKKLVYKDTEFSGDMDYMVSGNTSTEGSVVIPDSEYYIFEANGDQAELRMYPPFGEEDAWSWYVRGTNVKTIRMSAKGVEVTGHDMTYKANGWVGERCVDILGEQEDRVQLAASMKQNQEVGLGIHAEKSPAHIMVNNWNYSEILADETVTPDHWAQVVLTEAGPRLNQYKGDGRFPDVVTGKREWPLYGKILVVALPVTAAVAAALVIAKRRKNKPAQSE